MSRDDALARLISIRHHCFMRGIYGRKPVDDFRQAFRTLNRLYVELERHPEGSKRAALRRRRAA